MIAVYLGLMLGLVIIHLLGVLEPKELVKAFVWQTIAVFGCWLSTKLRGIT